MSVNTPDQVASHRGAIGALAQSSTETKASFKTTELIVYVVAVIGVLIASNMVGDQENRPDYFLADQAWLYITLLTIGYMISRGLAKSGSRGSFNPDR